jgi:excisionase family DNA binding protein
MSKPHDPYNCTLCTIAEAAEYLRVSESWLKRDRYSKNPKVTFVRLGQNAIRYRKADLDAYIASLT